MAAAGLALVEVQRVADLGSASTVDSTKVIEVDITAGTAASVVAYLMLDLKLSPTGTLSTGGSLHP